MRISLFLLIILLFASLLPLAFLAYNVNERTSDTITKRVRNHLISVANIQSNRLRELIADYYNLLKLVQSRTNLRELVFDYNLNRSTATQDLIIRNIRDLNSSSDQLTNIIILNQSGVIIASTTIDQLGVDFSSNEVMRGNDSNIIGLFFHDEKGSLKVHSAGPLIQNNTNVGIIVFEESTNDIRSMTGDYSGLQKTGETILARRDSNGNAIFITNTRFNKNASLNKTVDKSDLKIPITQALLMNELIMDNGIDYRGKTVLAVTRYIEEMDWGLVVKLDKEEAFKSVEELQNQIIITSAISAFVMILISFFLAGFFSKPISSLTNMADQISKGDLDTHVEISSFTEITHLGISFNKMAENLHQEKKARKTAEEQLHQRAIDLERSNKELEQFAFVASHDLQEPLRKVSTFGTRIQEKYGDILDDKGKDYLTRMKNATERMQILINDLLEFSRIRHSKSIFRNVDLNKVVKNVISNLDMNIEQLDAKINLSKLPNVFGNQIQLEQLFQNLVSNALKFHKSGIKPIINIHSKIGHETNEMIVKKEYWNIFIEDNGIGFDPKYSDRIFTIFQRLQPRSRYEGTGIGLAIARKIIEFHGGFIDVKSEVGQGATFIINLPKNINKVTEN